MFVPAVHAVDAFYMHQSATTLKPTTVEVDKNGTSYYTTLF